MTIESQGVGALDWNRIERVSTISDGPRGWGITLAPPPLDMPIASVPIDLGLTESVSVTATAGSNDLMLRVLGALAAGGLAWVLMRGRYRVAAALVAALAGGALAPRALAMLRSRRGA